MAKPPKKAPKPSTPEARKPGPALDYDLAAEAVLEANRSGNVAAADKFGISSRTVQRYIGLSQSDPILADRVATLLRAQTELRRAEVLDRVATWHAARSKTLSRGYEILGTLHELVLKQLTGDDAKVARDLEAALATSRIIREISQSLERSGTLDITNAALNPEPQSGERAPTDREGPAAPKT